MSGLSWDRVNELAQQGGDFVADMAKKAKDGVCELYRKYPAWSTAGFPVETPASQFARGFYDNLCREHPTGLPPTPKQRFSGGQCACVSYNVNLTQTTEFGQIIPFTLYGIPGKIRGVKQTAFVENNITYYRWTIDAGESTCPSNVVLAQKVSETVSYAITSVVRADGQADNCGNPPADWDAPQKREPSNSEKNNIVVYVDRSGNSFTIPFGYFQMNNDLDVNVDVGGIQFKLDLGGFEYKPTFNDGGQPESNNPGKCELDADTKRDINDILDAVDRIEEVANDAKDCACESKDEVKKIDPPEVDEDNKEEQQEETESKKESRDDIEAVKITLTQRPNRGTIQSGEGSPDWMAGGWFEWEVKGGGFSPRYPIHFDNNLFYRPLGVPVVGYAFTLTNGARGRVTVYRRNQNQ